VGNKAWKATVEAVGLALAVAARLEVAVVAAGNSQESNPKCC
jgi:hypothetical protein